jgi:hypothetical protein
MKRCTAGRFQVDKNVGALEQGLHHFQMASPRRERQRSVPVIFYYVIDVGAGVNQAFSNRRMPFI